MKPISYLFVATCILLVGSVGAEEMNPANVSARMGISSIVTGNTTFAFDLYAQLKSEDGNLFFSPYSISTALAMTYAGARNDTAAQIAQTMHYASNQREFHPTYRRLIDQLNEQGQKGNYQLSIANALWTQKDYTFLDTFINLNQRDYKAGLENVDFVDEIEREKTRQKINKWVEGKTNEKIKNLIPKGVLDEAIRMVLTNAIYFKGDWAEQFDTDSTQDADFFVLPDKTVTAPLMNQKKRFSYGENDLLQIVRLPYKGDDLSMLVLLPKAKNGLANLEKELIAENLSQWQQQVRNREVEVYLPKFKMTSQFSLNDTLSKMGMPDAFIPDVADFSGITGTKDLFISAVFHKAFVEVNEEGTEAAAATGVMVSTTSVEITPPPVFRADHPFVFIIQDTNTKSILFVGRVVDPTDIGK